MDKPISEIIDNTDVELINIPIFQRPYSWTQEQITQFISDLDNCVERTDQYHFYGLIVYVTNHENKKIIDIIDGQQRLTTLIILLSILRDLLEDIKINNKWPEDDENKISRAIHDLDKILSSELSDNFKVKLKTENESSFENDFLEIIQTKLTNFKEKDKSPRKEYEDQKEGDKNRFLIKKNYLYTYKDARKTRHKNSYKNYLTLHDHILINLHKCTNNSEKLNYLISQSKTIQNRFRIIPFKVESYERAFEYFEVLNDRGLDVSALDLIKNRCLQIENITQDQRSVIFNAWSKIFSNTLDQTFNLLQFVRYAYMCESGHISNKEIYSSYKDLLSTKNYFEIINFLEKPFLIKAQIFRDINLNESNLEPRLHNSILLLKSTKTVQWFSIAMAVLRPLYESQQINREAKNIIVKIFENLHEIMFTLNFTDKLANELEKRLPEISRTINYNSDIELYYLQLKRVLDKIIELKIELQLTFDKIDFSNPGDWVNSFEKNNALGQMFIFFLKYKSLTSNDVKIFISTLEHTLPQSYTKEKWPIIEEKNVEDIKRHIYSVGNFFVTHQSDNSEYGNKSAIEKLKLYREKKLFDVIDDERNELNYKNLNTWDFDIILKREEYIFSKFSNIINQ